MAGENSHRNAGYDFLIAMQQMHLSAFNQRIIVIADVADGVTLELPASMLPFTFLYVVLSFGKRRDCPAVFAHCVPAAVVKMQMAIDDDVDVFRPYSCRAEIF